MKITEQALPVARQDHNGLTLPVDIIFNICGLVCLEDAAKFRIKSLERFQLVCHQFRSVALASPRLWSCVDDRMSPERIHLQLARSSDAGMSVRMVYELDGTDDMHLPCKCAQWEIIQANQCRWTSAQITIEYYSDGPALSESEHYCIRTFPFKELTFPSVTALTPNIAIKCQDENINSMFEQAFPNLEEIVLIGYWGSEGMGILRPGAHSLKRLTVVVTAGDYVWTHSLLRLLRMSSISSIRMLTIDFSVPFNALNYELPDHEAVTLDEVETLDVHLSGRAESINPSSPYEVLTKITVPNVKRIFLKVERGAEFVYDEWLKEAVNPRMEKVEVVFSGIYLYDEKHKMIEDVSASLPSEFALDLEEAAERSVPLLIVRFEDA